ncbi:MULTISPECIES: hypothetical protein [unclassified Brevundimonas]|uniref:hypothetical protein n=1 Tax=unclassified Brevundimonas TaxID=2622653 RepID=UPI0025BF294F|nr:MULTISPECIES: hypothetical protein [unclassified Brevundimonas]
MTDTVNVPEAIERLAAVANGASVSDVYGGEWCINGPASFRADLSAALAAAPKAEQDYAELKRLAENASPGPWKACGTIYEHMNCEIRTGAKGEGQPIGQIWDAPNAFADGQFIAAASPSVVLDLIDRASHPAASDELPASILDIAVERQRQVAIEGWSHERDDGYVAGELAIAGACYGLIGSRNWAVDAVREIWPKGWSVRWLKSKPNNPRRDLVKAGALIAAEIERLDRLAKHKGPQS